jgi:tripartite ATP-independent transporter DctP family solute receptor
METKRGKWNARSAPLAITVFTVLCCILPAPTQAAEKTLRFGHILSATDPMQKAAERLGEVVAKETGGALEIRVYPNSQLGGERQIMEGLMLGTIDMGNVSVNVMQSFEPVSGITALPYLIRDFDHVFKVEDSTIGKDIDSRILAKTGVRVIGHTSTGFRVIATPVKPIQSLADFKGLKIRVPESPIMISTFKALGANPTPIPWGELYTSLQTKVVDAVESPPATLGDANIYEIAKAVSLTNHVYSGQFVLISEKVFQHLSEKQRQAILDGGRESTVWQRQEAVKQQAATLEQIQQRWNAKVYPVDTRPLQEAVKPVYQEFSKTIGNTTLIDHILNM